MVGEIMFSVKKQVVLCPYCGFDRVRADGKHSGRAYYECLDCKTDEKRPRRFSFPFDRDLRTTLPEGAWSDRRVFLFGGGGSVQQFDFSELKPGDRTIAINSAWKSFYGHGITPNLQFSGDQMFWKTVREDLLFRRAVGLVAALDQGRTLDRGFLIQTSDRRGHWARKFKDGIRWGKNSGVAAMNLAEVLGAREIHLVGFDLDGTNREGLVFDGVQNMHDGFLATFKEIAPKVQCKVIVHNPNSPLNKIKWGVKPKSRLNS